MKIMVTGSEGFIGRHLVSSLKTDGTKLVLFDKVLGDDLVNFESILERMKDCQGVVHLAAVSREKAASSDWLLTGEVNVLGTWSVLEAASSLAKPPWLILASTKLADDPSYYFSNVYGLSKHLIENISKVYFLHRNLSISILRLPMVYGPGDNPDKVIPVWVNQARKDIPLTIDSPNAEVFTSPVSEVVSQIKTEMATLSASVKPCLYACAVARENRTTMGILARRIQTGNLDIDG